MLEWLVLLSSSAGCWAPWSAASFWTELTPTKPQLSLFIFSRLLEWSCTLLHSDLAILLSSTSHQPVLGQLNHSKMKFNPCSAVSLWLVTYLLALNLRRKLPTLSLKEHQVVYLMLQPRFKQKIKLVC